MKRTILHRSTGIAAAALTLSMGLAACSSESETASESGGSASESPSETSSPSESEDTMAGGQPFGPACSQVPTSGPGSVEGMAEAPVATAASNNPLLSTLVEAVGQAKLVDTLNGAEELTVFAPANDAFAEVPKKDLNALLKDQKALTQVLSHHVVPQRLSPEQVAGELDTLNKDTLMVEGSGEDLSVGDEGASVLCGNVQTANATVYIIDTVMMPPSM